MERIICDICGSEYPQTAEICPTCGYPRQGNEKIALAVEETQRAKVKGGRFSRKNVRKLRKNRGQNSSDRGLWITIILLLLAIALVSAYIVLRFWGGSGGGSQNTRPTNPSTTASVPVETTVPCGSLVLDVTVVELEKQGEQVQLSVKTVPENTTDVVRYTSADPAVAQVSETGIITAVGPGQTSISVTCGTVTAECTVICWFREETTAPPETTLPPETTEATEATEPAVLKLDHVDASLFQPGEAFTIRVLLGDTYIGRSQATWTSSDPEVATVENGVVTAVGPGTANITAQYQGQKAVCIVRCQFQDNSWRASSTDVTLAVGESFRLSVINNSAETAEVVWSMSAEGVVSVEGSTVTGLAPGTVTLSATVEDVKVWCIVRVK